MAILSIDLTGWTTWSKQNRQAAKPFLRAYHNLVAASVRQQSGWLGTWQADGNNALFPDEDGEGAGRAVRAALEVRERWRIEYADHPPVRIAIGTGVVDWDPDPGAIASDDWNRVGHLQKDAPHGQVLITEDVWDAVPADLQASFGLLGISQQHPSVLCFATGRFPPVERGPFRLAVARARRDYVEHIRSRCERLDLRGLVPGPLVDAPGLRDVYVQPRLVRMPTKAASGEVVTEPEGQTTRPAERAERVAEPLRVVLGRERRLVVRGAPGMGKTTLVRYVALVCATGRQALRRELGIDARAIPVLVPVARWAACCGEGSTSALEGLKRVVAESESGFEEHGLVESLERGDAILLFDGLDEVGDSTERVRASRLMEEILGMFPRGRSIVTSRPIGFGGLTAVAGQVFDLGEWSSREAERYVVSLSEVLSPEPVGRDVVDALRESPRLAGLARTPLLATMAVLLHAGGRGHLPQSRADLFDHVVRALVETWDRLRSIDPARPVERIRYDHELKVLARVALRAFELHGVGAVRRGHLRRVAEEVLAARVEPGSDAGPAADAFLRRYTENCYLLVDRGPDHLGFHHAALQEYLAARGLLFDERLDETLIAHGDDPRWAEVLGLALFWRACKEGHEDEVARCLERFLSAEVEPGWRRAAEAVLRTRLLFVLALLADSPGLPPAVRREWVEAALDHGIDDHAPWHSLWLGDALDGLAESEAAEALSEGLAARTQPGPPQEEVQAALNAGDRSVSDQPRQASRTITSLKYVRRLPARYVEHLRTWHGTAHSMVQGAIEEALVRGDSLEPREFAQLYLERRLSMGGWQGTPGHLGAVLRRDPEVALWALRFVQQPRASSRNALVLADVLFGVAVAQPLGPPGLAAELRSIVDDRQHGAAMATLVLLAMGEETEPDAARWTAAFDEGRSLWLDYAAQHLAAVSPRVRRFLAAALPEAPPWAPLHAALGDAAALIAALVELPDWRTPEALIRARCHDEPEFATALVDVAVVQGGAVAYRILRMLDPAPKSQRERLTSEILAATDPLVVAGCLHALTGVAGDQVLERATDLVQAPDWQVRENALALLLSMGQAQRVSAEHAVELLADESESVRAVAAWVAAHVCVECPELAVPAMVNALGRPTESLVLVLGNSLTAPEHIFLALRALVASSSSGRAGATAD